MLCYRIIGNEPSKGEVHSNGNAVYIVKPNEWPCYLKIIMAVLKKIIQLA